MLKRPAHYAVGYKSRLAWRVGSVGELDLQEFESRVSRVHIRICPIVGPEK